LELIIILIKPRECNRFCFVFW